MNMKNKNWNIRITDISKEALKKIEKRHEDEFYSYFKYHDKGVCVECGRDKDRYYCRYCDRETLTMPLYLYLEAKHQARTCGGDFKKTAKYVLREYMKNDK